MDWADELAASVSGPQVINDSKTPSGTVHVGSLRGPVILDVIVRAMRARGLEITYLYGVDDMDPMDAQALLTPDAVADAMGRPLAHIPDQEADGHASYARHHAQIFIDIFAGLGIRPDRYYWMSEIYPTGEMDPFIRTALDKAALVRDIYRRVANVQHPDAWHPLQVVCENCGKIGTTIVTDWDGEQVAYECRERLVEWAHGCGHSGWVVAVRRSRQAAVEPRMGRPVVAVRGDDRAVRQGPLDRRRVARPLRRDRPRGLRTRAAAQRPVRVHQHRRQEDVDVQGSRRRRPRDRRRDPARAAPLLLPPPEAEPRASTSTRTAPTPSRGCTTSSTDSPPPRPGARSGARSPRATRRRSGTRCSIRTRTSQRRPRCSGRRSPTSRCFSRSRTSMSRARVEAEKGSPLNEREEQILDERIRAARRWLETYAPERARLTIRRDALPEEAAALDDGQRAYLAALAEAIEARRPEAGDAWQDAIFSTAAALGLEPRTAFAALYLAFLGRTNGPRAGWLLASLDRDFVVARLREAAGGCRRRCGMSVGLQRLRDDADAIRKGAIDKGEDPAVVDRALELDARRRALLGEGDASQGGAERGLEADRRGDQGRRVAGRPGGRRAEGRLDRGRRADRRHRRGARDGRGRGRGSAPADPEPGRSGRPDRWRGGERHGPDVGRAAPRRAAARRRGRRGRAGRWRDVDAGSRTGSSAEALDIIDNPRGAKIAGSGFPVYKGAGSALQRALINWFLDVHTRENGMTEIWPPAVVNTASATGTGQIPDKEDQMYVVTRDDLLPGPDRRGPGHEPPPRRDPRRRRAADPLRRLLAVLPARGRRGRQGHARDPPRPPVRQGRDGPVREARRVGGGARVDDRAGRDPAPAARAGLPRRC